MTFAHAPASPAFRLPPLAHAGLLLFSDLLSTAAFAALFALTRSAGLSAFAAIGVGVGQALFMVLRRRPIDAMQWISLALVMIFGLASVLTRNPAFIMVKPSLIYVAVGAGMLTPGWMNRYVPAGAEHLLTDVTRVFGYLWSGMMFLTAVLNLAFVFLDPRDWAMFVAVFPVASKIALFAVQYATSKVIGVRRHRRTFTRG